MSSRQRVSHLFASLGLLPAVALATGLSGFRCECRNRCGKSARGAAMSDETGSRPSRIQFQGGTEFAASAGRIASCAEHSGLKRMQALLMQAQRSNTFASWRFNDTTCSVSEAMLGRA